MTLSEFRDRLNKRWEDANAAADSQRDSTIALEWLLELHKGLDESGRQFLNTVLSEWLLSRDERHRFDAQFLISQARITELIPTLLVLADRLASEAGPGPKFEREKILKFVETLRL